MHLFGVWQGKKSCDAECQVVVQWNNSFSVISGQFMLLLISLCKNTSACFFYDLLNNLQKTLNSISWDIQLVDTFHQFCMTKILRIAFECYSSYREPKTLLLQ